jgi:CubicO group peptidase (beta-lactamase class C family)
VRWAAPFAFGLLFLSACSAAPAPWDGPGLSRPRLALTVEQLHAGALPELLDTSFLARPNWADDAEEPFIGELDLEMAELHLGFAGGRALYGGEDRFPAVTLGFVSDRGQLIPEVRGRALSGRASGSLWDVYPGTGAVWHEPEDEDWNRASFPLELTDRFFNQVRNCIATFVYRGNDVSPVYLQCSQETADLDDQQIGDLQAVVPALLGPASFDAGSVVEQHALHQARRLPVRPLSAFDTDGELAELFAEPLQTRASTSVGAVYADGTLFVQAPQTRHGPHPYPDAMRHGVYSVTKSLAGAVALFALAERYGEHVFDERITDHVPELADRPAWQGVTFSHALNMATGTRGGEAADLLYEPLVLADTRDEAVANIAALGDAPEAPGEAFRYATTNTFVLSVALQHYVEEQEGPGARYWELVREEVLDPIGAGDLPLLNTRDEDPASRVPLLGFGARPTLDEAAKIAALIRDEGTYEGQQILHAGRIREALGKTGWEGMRVDGRTRYRHAFWSRSVRVGGCRSEVSYMQGHGGNLVMLLPSGVLVFRFMDEQADDVRALARAAERLRSSCDPDSE